MTEGKIKVRPDINGRYMVLVERPKTLYDHEDDENPTEIVFSGSLADCEAYVNLNEKGYL